MDNEGQICIVHQIKNVQKDNKKIKIEVQQINELQIIFEI